MRTIWMAVRRCVAAASLAGLAASAAFAQPAAPATSPCLQKLHEQQLKDVGKKPRGKGGSIFGGILGGGVGLAAAQAACKNQTGTAKIACIAKMMAAGVTLGTVLGGKLDEQAQKKVKEASYTSAFTGRPQALALDGGCAVVETTQPITFERRDVDLPIAQGITVPPGVLKAMGQPYVTAAAAQVQPGPRASAKPLRKLPANSRAFVMGSVSDGQWLLLGQGSNDTGWTAAGYAPAKGWLVQPETLPPPETRVTAQNVHVPADIPCWTTRATFRVKEQQDSLDNHFCRGPDGGIDTPQIKVE